MATKAKKKRAPKNERTVYAPFFQYVDADEIGRVAYREETVEFTSAEVARGEALGVFEPRDVLSDKEIDALSGDDLNAALKDATDNADIASFLADEVFSDEEKREVLKLRRDGRKANR